MLTLAHLFFLHVNANICTNLLITHRSKSVKGNSSLSKEHRLAHSTLALCAIGARNSTWYDADTVSMARHGFVGPAGSGRSASRGTLWGLQLLCHSRQTRYHHAQRHATGATYSWHSSWIKLLAAVVVVVHVGKALCVFSWLCSTSCSWSRCYRWAGRVGFDQRRARN